MFDGMDPYVVLLIFTAVILVVSLAGAYIPFIKDMSSRQIHLMVALSAGIFLGILFFMLLPETFEEATSAENAAVWIIIGFLAVLMIDVILKRMHMQSCACESCKPDEHEHDLTSFSAFAGLAIHAAVDGMILSIGLSAGEEIGLAALVGVALHKFVELFSLSSTFMLTDVTKKRIFIYMFIFALITPIAAFVSMPIVNVVESLDIYLPLAIATGTFMYVGIYSLLPEAFHERRDSIISFLLVVAGIVTIAAITMVLGAGAHVH